MVWTTQPALVFRNMSEQPDNIREAQALIAESSDQVRSKNDMNIASSNHRSSLVKYNHRSSLVNSLRNQIYRLKESESEVNLFCFAVKVLTLNEICQHFHVLLIKSRELSSLFNELPVEFEFQFRLSRPHIFSTGGFDQSQCIF